MWEGWMWIGLWWASNKYGHGGNMSRVMGMMEHEAWLGWEGGETNNGMGCTKLVWRVTGVEWT